MRDLSGSRVPSYAEAPAPPLRRPEVDHWFLALVLLVSGTVTAPQIVSFGGTSGLGMWTLGAAGAAWVLWAGRPYFPRDLCGVALPLMLFVLFACLSMVWGGDSVPSVQVLAVNVGFLGLILLTTREAERDPRLVQTLGRTLDAASVLAAVAYGVTFLVCGEGGDLMIGGRPVVMARPFALFACVGVARQLARWQAGDRRGLWLAAWLTATVFVSQSRLALAVCVALFPLSYAARGDGRSVAKGLLVAAAGLALLAAAVLLYRPMYERMFAYDAKINVGGVAVNASGRTEMWKALLDDMHGSLWLFGKGIGASSRRIDQLNKALGHPHNDFLRYLYDTGACGLGLFVAFLLSALSRLSSAVRRAARRGAADLPVHLAALLGLVSLIAAMCTDNPVSYVYVMAPVGILIGCSLGRTRRDRREQWRRAGVGRDRINGAGPSHPPPQTPVGTNRRQSPEGVTGQAGFGAQRSGA